MRLCVTTIDLPGDLHGIVTSVAAHTGRSMNQTVADLIRRGLTVTAPGVDASSQTPLPLRISDRTGLPLIRSPRPVTADDVRALEDE